ncbi:MAG: hypothetical protein JST82_00020 [Bacteroidetes bacterium]|nr:hypothetical protein [Bacteroidota bacterium]
MENNDIVLIEFKGYVKAILAEYRNKLDETVAHKNSGNVIGFYLDNFKEITSRLTIEQIDALHKFQGDASECLDFMDKTMQFIKDELSKFNSEIRAYME